MTELLVITGLAITVGFQSGLIASWRFYRRQLEDLEAVRRRYECQIELLERALKRLGP